MAEAVQPHLRQLLLPRCPCHASRRPARRDGSFITATDERDGHGRRVRVDERGQRQSTARVWAARRRDARPAWRRRDGRSGGRRPAPDLAGFGVAGWRRAASAGHELRQRRREPLGPRRQATSAARDLRVGPGAGACRRARRPRLCPEHRRRLAHRFPARRRPAQSALRLAGRARRWGRSRTGGISPDGSKLVVTQRGTNELAIFAVGADGRLRGLHVMASSGPTPYGFAFAPDGTLIVTEAFGAQRGRPPRPRTHRRAARSRRYRARSATAAARSAGPSPRTTAAMRS